MGNPLVGVFAFIALFVLLALGMPVAFAMAFVAIVGLIAIGNFDIGIGLLSTDPFSIIAEYHMSALPLFVLMGAFAYRASVISDAFIAMNKWLGRLPGGLSIATIAGCAGFAACTGSSAASVGFMTMSTLPEMEKYKYDPRLASGTIAVGSTLGILIPPSIPLIVYGLYAQQSVGQLFIAGILPGVLLTFALVSTILIWVWVRPSHGPRGPRVSWPERFKSLSLIWPLILLAGVVLGGIWGGFFTPVEAGGVGSIGALLIGIFRRSMKLRGFLDALEDTVRISGFVFIILIGALMLNKLFTLTGLPTMLAQQVAEANLGPIAILFIISVFYLIGGCLMDTMGLMLLTMPILIPIVNVVGVDMIMYGILMVLMIEMAEITPPIGINVFIVAGMAKHIPMYTIFRGVAPFFVAILLVVVVIILVPEIATILPSTMMR